MRMKRGISIFALALLVSMQTSLFAKGVEANTLTTKEKAAGWELLFDGKSLDKWWTAQKGGEVEWAIEDGTASMRIVENGETIQAGHIVSRKMYSAFELSVDFKLTAKANSGIKYFVTKPKLLGLEYQLLDDELHPDAKLFTQVEGSRALACLYDMKKADDKKPFKGVGEWNTALIKVYPNNKVEHYLNGKKVLEYVRGSEEYREMVQKSKYTKNSTVGNPFGEAKEGYILIQDHKDQVYFRNIKIRDLSK